MIKCHNCGAQILEEAKFCPKCGAKNSVEEVEVEIEAPEKKSLKSTKKVNSFASNKRTVLLSSIAVLAIASFGVKTAFFNSNNKLGKESIPTSTKSEEKQVTKQKVKLPFTYQNGDVYGLMNYKLEIIKENVSSSPVIFNNSGVGVAYQNNEAFLIDINGKKITESTYDNIGYFSAPRMGRYEIPNLQSKNGTFDFTTQDENSENDYSSISGLINSKGEVVLEPGNYFLGAFNGKTLASFYKNDKSGVVNENGEIVLEPINDQTVVISEELIGTKKSNSESTYNVINLKGELVKETSYEQINPVEHHPEYFTVKNTLGKVGIIDNELNEIMAPTSASYLTISDDGKYAVFSENEKYGLCTITGDVLIEATYQYLSPPNENGILSFSEDGDIYNLMNLKEEVSDTYFDKNLYPVSRTNLFYEESFDSDNTQKTLYNDKGKILEVENRLTGYNEIFPANIYTLPITDEETKLPISPMTYRVFNKDGLRLSENATFLNDLGSELFIQEGSHIKIINKNSGKIIKEKEL